MHAGNIRSRGTQPATFVGEISDDPAASSANNAHAAQHWDAMPAMSAMEPRMKQWSRARAWAWAAAQSCPPDLAAPQRTTAPPRSEKSCRCCCCDGSPPRRASRRQAGSPGGGRRSVALGVLRSPWASPTLVQPVSPDTTSTLTCANLSRRAATMDAASGPLEQTLVHATRMKDPGMLPQPRAVPLPSGAGRHGQSPRRS